MSQQTKLPFTKTSAAPSAASSATAAASADESHRGEKRKQNYIHLNLSELDRLFAIGHGDSSSSAAASSAAAASSTADSTSTSSSSASSSSSSSSTPSKPRRLDPSFIRHTFRRRNSDMQKTIDDLIDASGLHPELHSNATSDSASKKAKTDSGSFTLNQVKGDLFTCPPTSSLAHCVSVDLAMGKGIATLFKSKFGGLAELKSQNKQVGEVAVLKRDARFVYYLITKPKYWNKPTYETLQRSLEAMRSHMENNGVTHVSMPRIGCGLDGLMWNQVVEVIERVFRNSKCQVTVYTI